MKNKYSGITGKIIKELRIAKKYSQRDLASKAGISCSSISYYENGREINLDVLNALCKALDVDMMDILSEAFKESQKK